MPRIIPARAGQTALGAGHGDHATDHPRACGANQHMTREEAEDAGSSPRVRGKHAGTDPHRVHGRIIPARAGQTARRPRSGRACTDHPRACGANASVWSGLYLAIGSSPRVRGKRLLYGAYVGAHRIIPARAGQTRPDTCPLPGRSDHPRACGANARKNGMSLRKTGSSPRVRGKHHPERAMARQDRIIPARAGQTRRRTCVPPSWPDHPRACGAN